MSPALAERRHVEPDHVEANEQVELELAGLDGAVGCAGQGSMVEWLDALTDARLREIELVAAALDVRAAARGR